MNTLIISELIFLTMKATIAIALLLSFAFVDVTNGGRLFLSDEEKRRLSKGAKGEKAYEADRRLANDCGECISACKDATTNPTPEECRESCKSGDCSPNGGGGGGKSGKSGGGSGGYGRDRKLII